MRGRSMIADAMARHRLLNGEVGTPRGILSGESWVEAECRRALEDMDERTMTWDVWWVEGVPSFLPRPRVDRARDA